MWWISFSGCQPQFMFEWQTEKFWRGCRTLLVIDQFIFFVLMFVASSGLYSFNTPPSHHGWIIDQDQWNICTTKVFFYFLFSYLTCPPWRSRAWFHVHPNYTFSSFDLKRVTPRGGIKTYFPYPCPPSSCKCGRAPWSKPIDQGDLTKLICLI